MKKKTEKSVKSKKKLGRPSTYNPKYPDQMIKFFEDRVDKPKDMPTLTKFAMELGIHPDTITDWGAKFPPFFRAIKRCKKIQEEVLIQNGLSSRYNTAFTIFCMKNLHGWKNEQQADNNQEIKIVISKEDQDL